MPSTRESLKLLPMGCSNRLEAVIKSTLVTPLLARGRIGLNTLLEHNMTVLENCDETSPYLLDNEGAYRVWRRRKLALRQQNSPSRIFRLDASGMLPADQLQAAQRQIDAYNFLAFETAEGEFGKRELVALNRQFGLFDLDQNLGADDDRVTALRVVEASDQRAQYIPYSNRAMNWHTDGYYNPHDRRINAFALYCVHQAARGGGNYLFDHEMMYLLIRDQSPDLLNALMQNDLMRIPANVQGNRVIRAEESGPVFSVEKQSCSLNMRYTSRPHNIVWKSDPRSQRALNLIREILMDSKETIELRLGDRQGVVCNNILHGRQAFHDDPGNPARLIYRARYYDRIDLGRAMAREPAA
jgi:hypothetical protein